MKIKAKLGAYSSIVGQPVLLLGEGGRAEAQITLLHHGDMFRDRAKQIELLTIVVNAINAAGDPRPFNCRFRLKETGQPYPRGGCNACGRSVTTGLGNQCSAVDGTLPLEVSQGTVSLEAMLRDESLMMARTEVADEVAKLQGYKDELLKIAAMVGEPEDPFAAWESIDHMLRRYVHMQNALIGLSHMIEQNTTGDPEPPHQVRIEGVLYGGPLADNFVNSMQAIKQVCINALGDIPVEVTVEDEEPDPIKEAFRAGWITNAGHEDGNYLTGCMEGDYRDWQKDPMGYFADAWKAAVLTDKEEDTFPPYVIAVGDAGQAYMNRFRTMHDLPVGFRWYELWNAMAAAAHKAVYSAPRPAREDFVQTYAMGDPRIVPVYDGTVSTDVPYPPKTNEDVMNALGAATIKADKLKVGEPAAVDGRKTYTTFTPATDTEPAHPYTVGPHTMREVFEPAGLQNLSDMQAVLDAVEAGLIRVAKRY